VFDQPIELIELLRSCIPSLDEWHRQRTVYIEKAADDLELGFATLFLNRTNRSGILTARPIGGLEQTGKWRLDARWNPRQLEDRIRRLARYSTRVTICEDDGIAVTTRCLRDSETFVYADPPYMAKGDGLYLDTLGPDDHQRLAATLRSADRWLLTYDTHPDVLDLYHGLRCAIFGIKHTASIQHIGTEYAVFPDSLVVPSLERLGRGDARFLAPELDRNQCLPGATSN
jgi:DNA adenine methylase